MISGLSWRQCLPLRTALALVLAAVGFTAFTASASANFTLSSGTIKLEEANHGSAGEPATGSWVELPENAEEKTGNGTFENAASEAKDKDYTPISGATASPGFKLGAYQAGEKEILGPLTEFGPKIGETSPFFGFTTKEQEYTNSKGEKVKVTGLPTPSLEFAGAEKTGGKLEKGNLEALWISYGGLPYYVGTRSGTSTKLFITALSGKIEGNAEKANTATITLEWRTHIQQPGFTPWDAKFKWVGKYSK